jgi:protein involved in polysaccharide export with SLBB domain
MTNKRHHFKAFASLLFGICLLTAGIAANLQAQDASNPNYRLSVRDRISITVFDEPELTMAQGIDAKGEIRVPLLGVFRVEGMTIREVEKMLEEQYVEQKILRVPIVTLDVLAYSPKEVSVLGAVARPGQIPFPPEVDKIDIVELISMVGGFTALSRSNSVKVTRTLPNGSQIVINVDVEAMIEGRKKNRAIEQTFIYPGDLIFVDERLF